MSLYNDLEIEASASPDEIKAAYRRLAKKHHPDKGGQVEKFQLVQKAYDVLSDPDKRKRYDEAGVTDTGPSIRSTAMQTLAQLLFQIMDSGQPLETTDLVEQLRQMAVAGKEKAQNHRKATKKKIATYRSTLKRFRVKKKKENLFVIFIEAQIRRLEVNAENEEHQVELGKEMLKILADYEYVKDEAKTPNLLMQYINATGNNTWR